MVLAKQLDKTVGDFHLVTRFHHKVQEEKNILEKKLIESEKNAKIQQQYVEELKVYICGVCRKNFSVLFWKTRLQL